MLYLLIVGEDMEGNTFINNAFTKSIQDYLTYKNNPNREEFSSFCVIVVRALVQIYGELDIVNPYRTNGERGFKDNLMKFGYSSEALDQFLQDVETFYENQENDEVCKDLFLKIQRDLIDMFVLRKKHVLVTDEELEQFKSLLYTKTDINPSKFVLYNKYSPNDETLLRYLSSKLYEIAHEFTFNVYKDVTLSADAYQLAGFNAVEVMNMKEEDILNINNKVYHFFRIKENDTNKRGRLEDAIRYYKKYGNTITSGNGYVDLLLILSVISTCLMILTVVFIKFMG